MKISTLSICIVSSLLTAPFAWASTQCHFTLECLISDACSETNFSAELNTSEPQTFINADGSQQVAASIGKLVSDAETVAGFIGFSKDDPEGLPTVFVSMPNAAAHWMTIQPDGSTFYTVHLAEAELAVTYRGTCKLKAE